MSNNNSNNNASSARGPPPGLRKSGGRSNDAKYTGGGGGGGGYNTNNGRSAPSSGNSVNSVQSKTNTAENGNNAAATASSSPIDMNRERYLHLLLSMVGHTVVITKTNGTVLEGIFHTFCPFEQQREGVKNVYVIKGAKLIQRATTTTTTTGKEGGSNNDNFQEGSTVLISSSHVRLVHLKSIRLDNNTSSSSSNTNNDEMFRTDAEISGQKGGTERLVAAGNVWTSAGDTNSNASGALESGVAGMNVGGGGARGGMFKGGGGTAIASSNNTTWGKPSGGLQGSIGNWDQFSANEQRFNVKASFDENLYTTKLDYKSLDAKKLADAERIAKEIESTTSSNIHLMEERNQKISADYDEEDLYSGVLKKKEESNGDGSTNEVGGGTSEQVKTMNYAAAAGAAKKTAADAAAAAAAVDTPTANEVESAKETKEVAEVDDKDERNETQENDDKEEETKPKLNPNAKAFTFNPTAKTFTPSFGGAPTAAATPAVAAVPPNPMEYPHGGMHPAMMGNYHPGMQYMQPGKINYYCSSSLVSLFDALKLPSEFTTISTLLAGMIPVMNAQHPQMRQSYSPHAGGPGQPMQPQPPAPGQEENSSVATGGEGSSNPSETQPLGPHPQQQYMQPGYVPQGSYPGYYGGAAAAAMMHHHPHQRPGFHPPPQMQVMPGGGYQRMGYPGMMQPMRGPPQPYYGHGGAPVPYPGGYDEGHKYQRKNSKGGNGNYKKRGSYNNNGGRGGGGGKGYRDNHSEGRQSSEGSSPVNPDGSGSENQPQQQEPKEEAAMDTAKANT